jgi:hypothetical protein
MKITRKQLKRIIRETIRDTILQQGPDWDAAPSPFLNRLDFQEWARNELTFDEWKRSPKLGGRWGEDDVDGISLLMILNHYQPKQIVDGEETPESKGWRQDLLSELFRKLVGWDNNISREVGELERKHGATVQKVRGY